MEATVYNKEGKKTGSITLPESIFALPWNADLIHDVLVTMATNARVNYAHTKDRGEVAGGGKKPWRQKGTGRARHGSSRSPIWVGGGIAHGPRNEKDFSRKLNKKVKQKALFTALSKKFSDGEVIFVDSLSVEKPNAKEARATLSVLGKISGNEKLSTKKKNAFLLALGPSSSAIKKSYANFANVETVEARNLTAGDVLSKSVLIIENPEFVINAFSAKKLLSK